MCVLALTKISHGPKFLRSNIISALADIISCVGLGRKATGYQKTCGTMTNAIDSTGLFV
jgi:hypothetical protein